MTEANAEPPTYRVHFIDDSAWDIHLFTRACARQGLALEIESSLNIQTGIYRLRTGEPVDAILVDIYFLGQPKGFDLIQSCRNDSNLNKALLVAVSGSNAPEDRNRANEFGADLYLLKDDVDVMAKGFKRAIERHMSRARTA